MIVLLDIDTQRADHLSCYGYGRQTSPAIDAVAEGGPFHVRGQLPRYLQRLRETGRAHHAAALESRAQPFEPAPAGRES